MASSEKVCASSKVCGGKTLPNTRTVLPSRINAWRVKRNSRLLPGSKKMAATNPAEQLLLIVEDNGATREALGAILRQAGYFVVGAANGQEALDCMVRAPAP